MQVTRPSWTTMTSTIPGIPGWTNASPTGQQARAAPETSSTLRRPNRAASRCATREPTRPPTQGAANTRPYCHGVNPSHQQEYGEQRLGRHDQAVDQDRVEEQRAQHAVGEDVAPPVEQIAGPQPGRRTFPYGGRFAAADGADAERREQIADGVGQHRRHRPEQPDGSAAERRSDHRRRPCGRLEAAVGDEQVFRRHKRLQIRAACRLEGDVGSRDEDGDDEELAEAEAGRARRRRGWSSSRRTGSGPSRS